jgi:tetratricopeptide (TPR) repeat protein
VTVSEAIPLRRYAARAMAAGLAIVALGVGYAGYQAWRNTDDDIAPFTPTHAVTHDVAAANQQGLPTTYDEQLAATNHRMAYAQAYADRLGVDWGAWGDLANLYLGRARQTGSFDDYAKAGQLYDKAFAVAQPGYGPHLDRAIYNFTVHRLNAVEPDLRAVDHYAIPEPGTTATVQGLRGDLAFYSGHYPEALALYRKSHTTLVIMSTSFRLAYYWGRMGDPNKARRYLDEAESQVIGPQQQQRSFLELYRGILSLDHGQWDDAEAHFRRAEAIFPGNWLVQEHLAMTLALKGHPDQAMAIYQGIAQRTNLPEASDAVAGLYRATGDFANAQAWAARADALWRKRLAQLPEAAYGHLVDHLLAFGAPAETLQVALKNYQARPYADAATQLAWAYMANHDPNNALKVLGPTLASGWVSAEPHIVASEAHALLGQGPEADAERKAALAINPHSLDRNPGLVWLEQ